jgi:serine/threonine protein kinase/tetratricopeptide (TPR) repeat protein
MNPTAAVSGQRESFSDHFALLVEELTARIQAGEAIDVEAFLQAHPEDAEQLRRLLPALFLLAEVSGPEGGTAPAAAPGDELGELGDFRLLREVGRGGMGIVYEAEQVSLGRRVALKVLPFAATLDPRQLQRFQNEARAAASLHHEHIIPVYSVGCERSVHFYAMQFIDGQTLAQLIHTLQAPDSQAQADAPATPDDRPANDVPTAPVAALSTERSGPRGRAYYRQAAELIAQAAEALEHAHSLAIVHRDIKPANLLVDPRGKLWVGDFGLARLGADAGLTLSGDLLGTLRYMAPEQALSRHGLVDHRADVYALGASLYELLTLRPAVTGTERAEVLRQVAFEEPVAPSKLDKGMPAELETIVLKAVEKNPADRYATAQELADDLRRFLEDRPIRARRPTLWQRLTKWGRRHKGVVRTAFAALVLAVVVLALSTAWIWKENQDKNAALVLAKKQQEAADQARRHAEGQSKRARTNFDKAMEAAQRMLTRVADEWVVAIPQMMEIRKRLFEDAVAFYTDLIDLNPDDARAYYERGRVYDLLGRYEQARADYERAAAMSPDNVTYHGTLAYSLQDCPDQRLRDKERSLDHARRMVELQPADAEARGMLATAYLKAGQQKEGVVELRKGAELARGTALEHKLLAVAEKEAGNWREVITRLKQARDIPPPDLWVYRSLADAHLALREEAQALAAIERGIELSLRPSDDPASLSQFHRRWRGIQAPWPTSDALAGLHFARGNIYSRQGKYAAALADFDSAMKAAVSSSRVWWWFTSRAEAHFHLGHYEQALADVSRAVEINPNNFINLIWIPPELVASCPDERFRAGILALAGKAIEQTGGKAGGYAARASLFVTLKQFDKAETVEDLGLGDSQRLGDLQNGFAPPVQRDHVADGHPQPIDHGFAAADAFEPDDVRMLGLDDFGHALASPEKDPHPGSV